MNDRALIAELEAHCDTLVRELADSRAQLAVAKYALLSQIDDPLLDATDGAHAAWWRGHDYTMAMVIRKITDVLDGRDTRDEGTPRNEWHKLRHRLIRLVRERSAHAGDGS